MRGYKLIYYRELLMLIGKVSEGKQLRTEDERIQLSGD